MSRRRATMAALITAASVLTAIQPASAEHETPFGVYCGITAEGTGMLIEAGRETGFLSAGPIVFPTGFGVVRCSIRVNGSPGYVAAEASGFGVVVLPPTSIQYAATSSDVVEVCSELWDGAGGYLLDCAETMTVAVPDLGDGQRGHKDGHARTGGNEKHDPQAPDETPPPPTQPYFPRGTIEISSTATGIVNYAFTDFVPAYSQWACPPPSGTTITCTPPPPAMGYRNVCRRVTVRATTTSHGTTYGSSACARAPGATASAAGPSTTPTEAEEPGDDEFPWTCAAAPVQSIVWTVRCTVGS